MKDLKTDHLSMGEKFGSRLSAEDTLRKNGVITLRDFMPKLSGMISIGELMSKRKVLVKHDD